MKIAAVILMSLLTTMNLKAQPSTAAMNKAALKELNTVLHERKMFIKIHAGEFLVWAGHPEAAKAAFLKENEQFGAEPKYRITIWRVLAQADKAGRQQWLDKIYAAYADEHGPDRIHASETLAKLKQAVYKKYPEITEKTIASPEIALHLYALWASSFGSAERTALVRQQMLHTTLTDTGVIAQNISAYTLRFIKGLSLAQWNQLADAAVKHDVSSPVYIAHYCSALIAAPAGVAKRTAKMKKEFLSHVPKFNAGQRTGVCQMLAEKGTRADLPLLWKFLNDEDVNGKYDTSADEGADLRATAAYAILKINSRAK